MARDGDGEGARGGLAALVAAAAQVLAPNALQFNALEFQRCVAHAREWRGRGRLIARSATSQVAESGAGRGERGRQARQARCVAPLEADWSDAEQ